MSITHTWTDHVTQTNSQRDRKVEQSQDSGANVFDEQVADQGRSNCRVRGLTDADLWKYKNLIWNQNLSKTGA